MANENLRKDAIIKNNMLALQSLLLLLFIITTILIKKDKFV